MTTEQIALRTKWTIDAQHSEICFKVKHLIVATVRGVFKEYDCSIYTTGNDFMSMETDVWINPASVCTGDEKRDEHLKGADFFDVLNHKEINFIANTYERLDSTGNYVLTGDLTLHGVTKRIKLNVVFKDIVKDPWGNHKAIFSIYGTINRKDWGIDWNTALDTGGLLVSDTVSIECEIQLTKVTE